MLVLGHSIETRSTIFESKVAFYMLHAFRKVSATLTLADEQKNYQGLHGAKYKYLEKSNTDNKKNSVKIA